MTAGRGKFKTKGIAERTGVMGNNVNRQILLVEKPTGKLGPEHFRLMEAAMPEPQRRRSAVARSLYFIGCG
jgi:NADPH-dependent curcumin reductase CurA